ncbi:hypothetical protein ABZ471_10740 [Streptomyces sp. NPDC005728]|uniref:hypothetical protein n=1 Tax=Streptomyces sp. NPDC005728 TaxID=3157054 RepID=UPI0033C3B496
MPRVLRLGRVLGRGSPTGRAVRVSREGIRRLVAAVHPSALPRAIDRTAVYDGLVADLRLVADVLADGGGRARRGEGR